MKPVTQTKIQTVRYLKKKKDELITKIRKFAATRNIPIDGFSVHNLLNFRFENAEYKCSVRCPYCPREIPCNNHKYWLCGNFTGHLHKHANTETEKNIDYSEPISDNNNKPSDQFQIIKRTEISHEELYDIMNFELPEPDSNVS